MTTTEIWITIGLLALATILTRCSFFLLGDAVKLPEKVQHALRYAPAAAMAAIVAPDLVFVDGTLDVHWTNPRLLAGLGAVAFFLATKHLLGTIVVGMVLYTALRLLRLVL
ncbi:AzlD domain-containing protein [Actimicrobium sp. CCI2.3]|uniref:AzlD domain-containing protein n=1 Tax=Actimicrobium sp. CCI2.3 TaxID=3048616 RepID=UPI002AB4E76F|nr:AzlD domain-containing protein [Actimicrobium sp. CCI2.3]MDY7575984.1 AzlD domain-containing protein [Actimicrobium sp. CCI2.3]MEB0023297.1 AzlD domain-containing protein [Actimicrobium sp. CCI2.3]